MKVFTVVGARPQFIKAAPLTTCLRLQHDEFLVHTGQHYDEEMSDVFFRQLGIPRPDVNLNIGSGSHATQTAKMLVGLEQLMEQQVPDFVLVYGDTNSTLAAALAAAKLGLPIAHVEAGLRSFNRDMPEEINRVLTDHLSTLLLCPTFAAVYNLEHEGITKGVVITGDIMVDAVYNNIEKARAVSTVLSELSLSPSEDFAVVTIHRPVNTDNPITLEAIVKGLNELDIPLIFPVHPRTRKMLSNVAVSFREHIHLVPPLGYLDMLCVIDAASVLITDSGGLQKEAYLLRTPCLTVRSETEWVETVESGWNRLVEPSTQAIVDGAQQSLTNVPDEHPDFYGDGQSAQRIVTALQQAAVV